MIDFSHKYYYLDWICHCVVVALLYWLLLKYVINHEKMINNNKLSYGIINHNKLTTSACANWVTVNYYYCDVMPHD